MSAINSINEELTDPDLFVQAMERLDQANTLMDLHCPGCSGYVDLSQCDGRTAGNYLGAIKALTAQAVDLLNAHAARLDERPKNKK